MLLSNVTEENNTSENIVASSDGTDMSKTIDDETTRKFKEDNRTVRGHLLNHMSNPLFDLFITFKSTKVIWEKLEMKYGANDVGKKKYMVGEWLGFQITDDKPIMKHVHIYENLCTKVLNENMKMCEIL